MVKKAKSKKYIYAVGKRKSSSARVRLYKGQGESMVNNMSFEKYFPGSTARMLWSRPFDLTGSLGKYFVSVKVRGGGKKGQLEAVTHGIAKALALAKPDKFRLILKKAGLLTRDSRVRQRRMVGTGGKARRQKQSPKR